MAKRIKLSYEIGPTFCFKFRYRFLVIMLIIKYSVCTCFPCVFVFHMARSGEKNQRFQYVLIAEVNTL